MRTVHLIVAAVAATSMVAPVASSQGRPLVRVTHDAACCRTPFIGTLVAETADSVWIRPERASSSSAPFALPRRSVQGIERGERVGAHKLVGAATGLLGGVLLGAVMGHASECDCDMRGMATPLGAMTGGLVGLLTGALIGAVIPHYQWERAEAPRPIGIEPVPLPQGGIELRVSLRR